MSSLCKWLSPVFYWVLFLIPVWASAQEQRSPFLRAFKVQDGKSELYETSMAAAPGDKLVLLGSGFGNKEGRVTIGQMGGKIVKWSDTSITLTVPEQKGSSRVNLTIRNASGKSCQVIFHYVPKQEPKANEKEKP